MVEEFDDDGSGLIEFEEFLVLMAKKVAASKCIPCIFLILPLSEDKDLSFRSSSH